MPAKILSQSDIVHLISFARARHSLYALRDATIIAISIFAGLRSAEIAVLKFDDITTPTGELAVVLEVRSEGAKYGKARKVPIRAPLDAILRHYLEDTGIVCGYLFRSLGGDPILSNSLQQQYRRIASEAGFSGVSSHSGRRTYITTLARMAGFAGCTLVDVQILAGHACLNSTEAYIEPSDQETRMIDRAFEGLASSLAPSGSVDAAPEIALPAAFEARRGSRRSGHQSHHSRRQRFRKRSAQQEYVPVVGVERENDARDPGNSKAALESTGANAASGLGAFLRLIGWSRRSNTG